MGLPDGEKIEDMCNRLERIPACDEQTIFGQYLALSPKYCKVEP